MLVIIYKRTVYMGGWGGVGGRGEASISFGATKETKRCACLVLCVHVQRDLMRGDVH
jgi:hypothetical protein